MFSAIFASFVFCAVCIALWVVVRRTRAVQKISGELSGPVAQLQEQILMTTDSSIDRLDAKIAQMEILLGEIDRRSALMAQQSSQLQFKQLQLEQQQQQIMHWLQNQNQQLEKDFELRRAMLAAPPVLPGKKDSPEIADISSAVQMPVLSTNGRSSVKRASSLDNFPPQDKRATILAMAEQGFSVTDIAQRMGVGKGEILLLLKLRKKTAP